MAASTRTSRLLSDNDESDRRAPRRFRMCPAGALSCQPVGRDKTSGIEKVFLSLLSAQALILVGLSLAIIIAPGDVQPYSARVYSGLGLLSTCGMVLFAVDSIFNENKLQLGAAMVINAFILCYLIWAAVKDGHHFGDVWQHARWWIVGLEGLFSVAILALSIPILQGFVFIDYDVVGADISMQRRYQLHRAVVTTVLLDLCVTGLLVMLAGAFLFGLTDIQEDFGIASLVVSLVLAPMAWGAIRTESAGLVWIVILFSLPQPAYIVWELYWLHNHPEKVPSGVTMGQFAVVGALSIVTRLTMDGVLLANVREFGYGLRQILYEEDGLERDLPATPEEDTANLLGSRLAIAWNDELKRADGKPSLARAMYNSGLVYQYLVAGLWVYIISAAKILQAFTLGFLVQSLEETGGQSVEPYLYSIALIVFVILASAGHHTYFFTAWRMGMRMRIATTSLVYGKLLRTTLTSLAGSGTGQVVNLVSTDIERFQKVTQFGTYTISGIVDLIAIAICLWWQIGVAAFAGLGALLILLVPMQGFFAVTFGKLRGKTTRLTDERVRLTEQAISGMNVVKTNAWEGPMRSRISEVRDVESGLVRRANSLRAVNASMFLVSGTVVSAVMFLVSSSLGNAITPRQVFTVLGLLSVLQFSTTGMTPMGLEALAEIRTTLARLEAFLLSDEVQQDAAASLKDADRSEGTGPILSIRDLAVEWPASVVEGSSDKNAAAKPAARGDVEAPPEAGGDSFQLRGVNMEVGPGDLHLVVGEVGSGKSTLLLSILGELDENALAGEQLVAAVGANDTAAAAAAERPPTPAGQGQTSTQLQSVAASRLGEAHLIKKPLWPDVLASAPTTNPLQAQAEGGANRSVVHAAGTIRVAGRVAYSPQHAWVISGTLRDNILMGQPMDPQRYAETLVACCLVPDLQQLDGGDLCPLGERGVTLSGGQRARLGLARAVYRDASLFLLDDPLSAVDAKVGRRIVFRCVRGLLQEQRRAGVVLVTHHLQHVGLATSHTSLRSGRVVDLDEAAVRAVHDIVSGRQAPRGDGVDSAQAADQEGQAEEAAVANDAAAAEVEDTGSASSADPISGLTKHLRADALVQIDEWTALSEDFDIACEPPAALAQLAAEVRAEADQRGVTPSATPASLGVEGGDGDEGAGQVPKGTRQLVDKEKAQQGVVTRETYAAYFRSAGGCYVVGAVAVLMTITVILLVGCNFWLSSWAEQPADEQSELYWRLVYLGLMLGAFFFTVSRSIFFFNMAVNASRRLHAGMLDGVLASPMRFFESQPTGRILNRFSKDLHFVDDLLPFTLHDFLSILSVIIGTVIFACVVNPLVVVVTLPAIYLFVWLRNYFLRTARTVKRIEATSRSPVFSLFAETATGIATARSFGLQATLQQEMAKRLDDNSRSFFAFLCTSRWLGLRLDAMVVVFLAAQLFSSIQLATMNPSFVALSLTMLIQLAQTLQWAVRQSAEVENQMISVERCAEYSKLPTEAVALEGVDDGRPAVTDGAVEARNLWMRYPGSERSALRGVSFSLPPGCKAAVVGRTGAGKSSLVAALLRLVEPLDKVPDEAALDPAATAAAHDVGSPAPGFLLDGRPVTEMQLSSLRASVAVISQDPVLFKGSLRGNIDPFNAFSDEQLWGAVRRVQLSQWAERRDGLETQVEAGGSNLSVGQRQLLCCARAVLRQCKVIVLDEPSASVDFATDQLLQAAIRTEFATATVITIAHRIGTVMDSDKVIVMDAGQVVECGSPAELLRPEAAGFFRQLVEDSRGHHAGDEEDDAGANAGGDGAEALLG